MNENKNKCVVYKESQHPIFCCDKYLKLNIDDRFKLVRLHKLCELTLFESKPQKIPVLFKVQMLLWK